MLRGSVGESFHRVHVFVDYYVSEGTLSPGVNRRIESESYQSGAYRRWYINIATLEFSHNHNKQRNRFIYRNFDSGKHIIFITSLLLTDIVNNSYLSYVGKESYQDIIKNILSELSAHVKFQLNQQ